MSDSASSPPPQQPPLRPGIKDIATCLIITLGVGLVLQLWLSRQVDLRDHPGPAGVGMMVQAFQLSPEQDMLERLTRLFVWLTGGNMIGAARWMSRVGYLAWVAGASLAGLALGGTLPGIAAGLLSATWALVVHLGLLFGPDASALGYTSLGVGITWLAASRGTYVSLLPAILGAVLAIWATQLKVISLPMFALFVVAPLLVPRGNILRLLMLIGVGGTLLAGYTEVLAPQITATQATTGGNLRFMFEPAEGWRLLLSRAKLLPLGHFSLLAGLAFLGGLWPGRSFKLRLSIVVVGLFLVGQTATQLAGVLRPRYVIGSSFPLLVVAGMWGGLIAQQLRRLPGVWLAPVVILPLAGWFDTLAYTHTWSEARRLAQGSRADTLPAPPSFFSQPYESRVSAVDVHEISEAGMVEMDGLIAHSPRTGVAGMALQDSRENHFLLAAELYQRPHELVAPQRCCDEGQDLKECVRGVVQTVQDDGWFLILPRYFPGDVRLPLDQVTWGALLVEEARRQGLSEMVTPWWRLFTGSGSAGGKGPCAGRGQAPMPPMGVAPPPPK